MNKEIFTTLKQVLKKGSVPGKLAESWCQLFLIFVHVVMRTALQDLRNKDDYQLRFRKSEVPILTVPPLVERVVT